VQLHDSGDLDAARGEAEALLQSLQEHGVDSLSLRFLLGTWALEAEDGFAAEALFELVAAAGEGQGVLSEQAEIQLREARLLAYGEDAVALASARELFEAGDWPGAEEILKLLFLRGEDGAVLAKAEVFRDEMRRAATEQGALLLAQVDELLAGPGPYGEAGVLLAEVEGLPGGTWNAVELRRLRGWYEEVRATEVAIGPSIGPAEGSQAAVLDAARALVAAMDYRGALARFAELEGSPLQAAARLEASRAADTLVKEQRVRAGRLFVAARKETRPAVRLAALRQVHDLLASLLQEFPGSKYAKRAQDNLRSVEEQIATTETQLGDADPAP
jgi:hypothetical protein